MFLYVIPRSSLLQTRNIFISMAHLKRNLADLSSSDSDGDDVPAKTVKTDSDKDALTNSEFGDKRKRDSKLTTNGSKVQGGES